MHPFKEFSFSSFFGGESSSWTGFSGPMHTGRNARCNAKKWSQIPFCCLLCYALLIACSMNSPVATIGFVPPNLLRFSHRVWCAWGLSRRRKRGSDPAGCLTPSIFLKSCSFQPKTTILLISTSPVRFSGLSSRGQNPSWIRMARGARFCNLVTSNDEVSVWKRQ